MRKLIGAIAAAALVALLVAPATAAGTKSGCKGKWTDAGICTFTYEGGAFAVQANAIGGDPATMVSVRLEAAGPAPGTHVLLLSCGVAASPAGAPAAWGSASTGDEAYTPQVGDELTCTVMGSGTGKYRCSSGG